MVAEACGLAQELAALDTPAMLRFQSHSMLEGTPSDLTQSLKPGSLSSLTCSWMQIVAEACGLAQTLAALNTPAMLRFQSHRLDQPVEAGPQLASPEHWDAVLVRLSMTDADRFEGLYLRLPETEHSQDNSRQAGSCSILMFLQLNSAATTAGLSGRCFTSRGACRPFARSCWAAAGLDELASLGDCLPFTSESTTVYCSPAADVCRAGAAGIFGELPQQGWMPAWLLAAPLARSSASRTSAWSSTLCLCRQPCSPQTSSWRSPCPCAGCSWPPWESCCSAGWT